MPVYTPPINDIKFVLHDVLDAQSLSKLSGYEDVSEDLIDSIIEEGGKICEHVLFPLNLSGDQEGCTFKDGEVTTPKGFKDAYDTFF